MKLLRVIAATALFLPSCASITSRGAIVVGGSGTAEGIGWRLVYNHEKSFAAATNTIGAAAAGLITKGALP